MNSFSKTPLTSDDTKELFDPHAGIDPAEELLHVVSPALQDGTIRLSHCPLVTAVSCGTGRPPDVHIAHLTSEDSAYPAQHLIQPLFMEKREINHDENALRKYAY